MAELIAIREFARRAGCDPKQVRRAMKSGALPLSADGKLDASLVDGGWRKTRRDTKDPVAPKAAGVGEDMQKNVPTSMSPPEAETVDGVPVQQSAEGATLRRAITHKEDFAGRLKELEYRKKAGELVELDMARQILFDEFRAARDAWLNWPTRFAALIAADLGIEQADRVAEVLTNYVHKQLATLGEPRGEFRKG